MYKCPMCDRDNRAGARFCIYCQCVLNLKELRQPDGTIRIGTVLLNRYRLVKLLGAGGFGDVYLADDTRIQGRRVAVKESFDTSPGACRQFEREAQLLAHLKHPQLVGVTDYFALPSDELFLVMDYVEGESLGEMLDRSGPLPEKQAVEYMKQVCEVLEYLHTWVDPTTGQRAPIIHRDIKPDNLKLTPQGQVVVIDLGIAKIYDPKRPTTVGAKGVAPGFSPPEQYGQGRTDARSDIYALGATLYCLLTGEIPPEATDRVADQTPVPPPRQFNPAVSPQTERVIEIAMQIQAQNRYQSAMEMRLELESLKPIRRARLEDLDTNLAQLLKRELSPASIKGGTKRAKLRITNRGQEHFSGEVIVSKGAPWFSVPNPWIDCPLGQTVTIDIHVDPKKYSAWRDFSFRPIAIKRRSAQLPRPSPAAPPLPVYPPPPPVAPEFQPPVDRPSMRLKPEHTGWTSYAQKHIIEGLILQEDLERLKSFIADSEGGRFVLTGYGRFGGTSLVKGAINRAQRGLSEGALLVFYFNVRGSSEQIGKFEIEANEFSFGKLTTHYEDAVDDPGLAALKTHADRVEPFSDTSPVPLTCHFSLTTPLDESFFSRSGLTGLFSKRRSVREFDFTKLVAELNAFFDKGKNNSNLQEIVLRLVGSEVLPSRVVIILDRIRRLQTLEALAQLRLFRNERITAIAVVRKEDLDQWDNCKQRLNKIGFIKWYVPCLWQRKTDYMERIPQTLVEPYGPHGSEAKSLVISLLKHLEFRGKGAWGDVLGELKHPQYWASDEEGNRYLWLDALPRPTNIQHNAWMQDVLNLNWPAILANLFAGREMDEREDRARIGVYHLLDWIAEEQIFTKEQLLEASRTVPITISDNPHVASEVVRNLLRVLERNRYLRLIGSQYRVVWDKSALPNPRKVRVRIPPAPSEPPEPPTPPPGEAAPDEITEDQPVGLPEPIEVFFSYSHTDERLRDELEKHLSILKRQGVIAGWHDRKIGAGKEWEGVIDMHLNTARVILLLISADFLASDYCYDVEMKRAMQRHEAGEARVIPVILRPCEWKGTPFGKFQALPKDGMPVTSWTDPDKAFLNVAQGIGAVVEELA